MKYTLKNILIATAILSAPLLAFTAEKDSSKPEYQLPEYKVEDLTLPVPSKVVAPRLGSRFLGQTVRMRFEISADGRAHSIRQQGISFDQNANDLVATMELILRCWEFEPAKDAFGNSIAVNVIMPVKVVKKGAHPTAIVSLIVEGNKARLDG